MTSNKQDSIINQEGALSVVVHSTAKGNRKTHSNVTVFLRDPLSHLHLNSRQPLSLIPHTILPITHTPAGLYISLNMSNRTVTKKTGHAKASVGSTVIAETDKWVEVDGNVYFPPDALRREYVGGVEAKATGHSTHCPWKGDASYYTVDVDGKFGLVLCTYISYRITLRSLCLFCLESSWVVRRSGFRVTIYTDECHLVK